MGPRELALLEGTRGVLRAGTPKETAELESLVKVGYVLREDPPAAFPNSQRPQPIYRLTPLGDVAIQDANRKP